MIEVKGLSVKYVSTGQEVLKDITFSVKRGEVIAVLGPSGCGKTTLLNVIQGLLSTNEIEARGEIQFSENSKVRTVFQDSRLLPWRNLLDNVAFGLEALGTEKEIARGESLKYLKLVGLEDFKNHLPSQVSIGMKQRINFARALVCKSNILLLDEPFSALDIDTKKLLQDEFLKILKEKKITSIFVTHNIEEAFLLADRIILLTKGPAEVEDILTKDELKKVPENALMDFDPFEG